MKYTKPHRFRTISEYHKYRGLTKPHHPLVSVIHFDELEQLTGLEKICVFDFYSIALKRNVGSHLKFKYGQQSYDFDEGIMFFISPNQVFSVETDGNYKLSGWMLLIHPDYFLQTSLRKSIKQYEYFSYASNEALHLSDKEETIVINIFKNIQQEYLSNIDEYSQPIIISQIELLLQYGDRFYHRQFITRKANTPQILERLEETFEQLFTHDRLQNGTPTVQQIAQSLHMSPNYLNSLLKQLTGETTQQHLQNKLIEKAKEKLSATELSISEIAYRLGFEYPQSFSKFFKAKTNYSPQEFRQSLS